MREAKRATCKAGVYQERLRRGAMWYLDDLFELLAFIVVLWAWKINGARAKKCQEQLVLLTMGKDGAGMSGKDGGGSDNHEGFVSEEVEMAEDVVKL